MKISNSDIRRFYLSKGCPPLWTGWAICEVKGNTSWPVLYLRKPAHLKQKEWENIVLSLFNIK